MSMAEIYSISKARRRAASPRLPFPESLLACAEFFGFDLPKTFTSFYLCRSKQGTQVFIKSEHLTLNLSAATETYPSNFKAARQWVSAMADRYGWQLHETKDRL